MPIHVPTPGYNQYLSTGSSCCPSECPPNQCPDHIIRRHDTLPSFKVNIGGCDGPMDLEGLVLEVNMWAKARLKKAICITDTYFQLADNIGFNQCMIGDVIIMDRVRMPEQMLVIGFDEDNYFIEVQRGYNGTAVSNWKKGNKLRIFRIMNSPAITESNYEDREDLDGSITNNVLTDSYLVYEWSPQDTCLPGCFWLEFKLLKMKAKQFFIPGGKWIGTVTTDSTGSFFTGETLTNSSVPVSLGLGDANKLIARIKRYLPYPLYQDPNFIEPEIPSVDDANYDLWRVIVHLYPSPTDVMLRWRIWAQLQHMILPGEWYTLPDNAHWSGAVHMWTDSNWYTGSIHDMGSVQLEVNGVPPQPYATYNENGLVSSLSEHLAERTDPYGLYNGFPYTVEPDRFYDYDFSNSVSIFCCDNNGISNDFISCGTISNIIPSFAPISGISNISDILTPSGISQIDQDFGCELGIGIESVRRFPIEKEGFLIKIHDTSTGEG